MRDRPSHASVAEKFPRDLILKAVKATGCELSGLAGAIKLEALAEQIRRWGYFTQQSLDAASAELRPPDIRKSLDEAQRAGQVFSDKLDALGGHAELSLHRSAARDHPLWAIVGNHRVEAARAQVDNLGIWLEAATVDKSDVGSGPKGNRMLIRASAVGQLGTVYRDFTGKRPTLSTKTTGKRKHYGPFRDFVILCLRPLFATESETDIDRVIRKVVKAIKVGFPAGF